MNSDGQIREVPEGESPKPDEVPVKAAHVPALKDMRRRARQAYYAVMRKTGDHGKAMTAALAAQTDGRR